MKNEKKSLLGTVSRSRRKLVSRPGAVIRVEVIELSGELERGLTTTATSLPGYRAERKRSR